MIQETHDAEEQVERQRVALSKSNVNGDPGVFVKKPKIAGAPSKTIVRAFEFMP